ncbi:DUF1996 domain-containing protein [Plantactinospora sp. GCM10030261]
MHTTPQARYAVALLVTVELALAAVSMGLAWWASPPDPSDRPAVEIRRAARLPPDPVPAPGAATGSFTWSCGRNENGHVNSANVVVTPGAPGPVHHQHDYVGNLHVDAASTVDDLTSGATSCVNGDRSTYYWPVLRTLDDRGGPHGEIRVPDEVTLTYLGSPAGPVVGAPTLLVGVIGDAFAATNGGARASATWTCAGSPDRRTTAYPICPDGERVVRVFDFPGCWDGRREDSRGHRAHLLAADVTGRCPRGTFAVPRLRITVGYDLPAGADFVIDGFPDQRHDPSTDHAFAVNAMPDRLMSEVVRCLNAGIRCGPEPA